MRKQQCLIHIYGDGEQSVLALDRLCVLEKVEWWYVDEREVGHVCAQFDEETMVEHLLLWALYFQVEVVMAYIDGDSPRGCKFRNYADSRVPAGAHEACVHVLRHPELWKEEQEKGRKWLKRRLACVLSFAMELVVASVAADPVWAERQTVEAVQFLFGFGRRIRQEGSGRPTSQCDGESLSGT